MFKWQVRVQMARINQDVQSHFLCKTFQSTAYKTPFKPLLVEQTPASPTAARCKCVIKLPLNVSGDTIYFDNSEKTVVYFKLELNSSPLLQLRKILPAHFPSSYHREGKGASRTSWNSRLSALEEISTLCLHIWGP